MTTKPWEMGWQSKPSLPKPPSPIEKPATDTGGKKPWEIGWQPQEPKKLTPPQQKMEAQRRATATGRAAGESGVTGGLAEIPRSLARGAVRTVEMLGKTGQFLDPEGGVDIVHDAGTSVREFAEETLAENPELQETTLAEVRREQDPYSFRAGVEEAGEMFVPSMGPALAGAAIGTAVAPGPGTAIGGAIGFLASLPLYFGSQAQETYEFAYEPLKQKYMEEGLDEPMAAEKAHDEAYTAGLKTGGIEAGGELLADAVTFRLFRLMPRSVKQNVARAVTKGIRNTREMIKDLAAITTAEVGTELGQVAGQQYVESELGVDIADAPSWDSIKGVVVPTAIMSAFTFGGAETVGGLRRRAVAKTLADPNSSYADKLKASKAVEQAVAQEDPELAQLWREFAQVQIDAGQAVIAPEDNVIRKQGTVAKAVKRAGRLAPPPGVKYGPPSVPYEKEVEPTSLTSPQQAYQPAQEDVIEYTPTTPEQVKEHIERQTPPNVRQQRFADRGEIDTSGLSLEAGTVDFSTLDDAAVNTEVSNRREQLYQAIENKVDEQKQEALQQSLWEAENEQAIRINRAYQNNIETPYNIPVDARRDLNENAQNELQRLIHMYSNAGRYEPTQQEIDDITRGYLLGQQNEPMPKEARTGTALEAGYKYGHDSALLDPWVGDEAIEAAKIPRPDGKLSKNLSALLEKADEASLAQDAEGLQAAQQEAEAMVGRARSEKSKQQAQHVADQIAHIYKGVTGSKSEQAEKSQATEKESETEEKAEKSPDRGKESAQEQPASGIIEEESQQEAESAGTEGIEVEELTDEQAAQHFQQAEERQPGPGELPAQEVVHATVAGGPAEQGWAERTRVTREGQPAVVWRGAASDLISEHFEREALGKTTQRPSSGLGVWFTIDQGEAREYAGDSGVVGEYHLDIRNPYVYRVEELPGFDSLDEAYQHRESLKKQGHDGIMIDARHVDGPVHYVVFDANQVVHPQPTTEQTEETTEKTEPPKEEAKTEAEPNEILTKSGKPFKSRQAAKMLKARKKLDDYEVVEVEGGWALRKQETTDAETIRGDQGPADEGRDVGEEGEGARGQDKQQPESEQPVEAAPEEETQADDAARKERNQRRTQKVVYDTVINHADVVAAANEPAGGFKDAMDKVVTTHIKNAIAEAQSTSDSETEQALQELLVKGKPNPDVYDDKFYQSAQAKAKRLKKKADRQKRIEEHKETINQAKVASFADKHPDMADDTVVLREFNLGWNHAVEGGTASNLPRGEDMSYIQSGYDAGRAWLSTEEGKNFAKGTKGKKMKGVGPRLRRWWQLAAKDIDEADPKDPGSFMKTIWKATARADVFSLEIQEGAKPGLARYLDEIRRNIKPFSEWYGSTRTYRRAYWKNAIEETVTDGRGDEVAAAAKAYIEKVSQVRELFNDTNTVEGAAKILHQRLDEDTEFQELIRDIATKHGWDLRRWAWDNERSAAKQWWRLQEMIKNEDADNVDAGKTRRQPLKRPRFDRVKRDGFKDHRNSKNVSADDLVKTFGFAGVTYGDYVTSKQRQDHTNYAYDAFMDLADTLGLSPKDMSMGGTLHLAFGALGQGRHAAHYSPNQPLAEGNEVQVINLTNTTGDGSLAHEWFHALDFALRQNAGVDITAANRFNQVPYVRQMIALTRWEIRSKENIKNEVNMFLEGTAYWQRGGRKIRQDKVESARYTINEIRANLQKIKDQGAGTASRMNLFANKSNYYRDALQLDKGNARNPYWSNSNELFARAGEAFVYDKMTGTDTYLVSSWVAEDEVKAPAYRGRPYPAGDERARIAGYFDELLKNVEWTPKGPQIKEGVDSPLESQINELLGYLDELKSELPEDETALEQQKREEEQRSKEEEIQRIREELAQQEAGGHDQPDHDNLEAELSSLSADDIDGIVDEVFDAVDEQEQDQFHQETEQAEKSQGKTKTTAPKDSPGSGERRGLKNIIKSAANNGFTGMDEALTGLVELFGGNNLKSFPAGVDPEKYEKAKVHFEAAWTHAKSLGKDLREFVAELKRLFGDGIAPYIKLWLHEKQTAALGQKQSGEETQKEAPDIVEPDPMVSELYQVIVDGNMPSNNNQLRAIVGKVLDKSAKAVSPAELKKGQEALEAASVLRARELVEEHRGDDQATFDALLDLYQGQPNLNIRSSTSVQNQAYSTPAPLAYLAGRLARIDDKTKVFEPTAGNGMLLIGAAPSNVHTVETEAYRAHNLRAQGFHVREGNVLAQGAIPAGTADAVIMNPPFDSTEETRIDGYKIKRLDHLIAAKALQAMQSKGRGTIIIGANFKAGDFTEAERVFFNWLYSNYHVADHVEINGKLYGRQGASWPVRLITVAGRKTSNTYAPKPGTINRLNTWSEVYEHYQSALRSTRNVESNVTGARMEEERPADPDARGAQGGAVTGEGPGGRETGPEDTGVRGRSDTTDRGNGTGTERPGARDTDKGTGRVADANRRDEQPADRDRLGERERTTDQGQEAGAAVSDTDASGAARSAVAGELQTTYKPRSSGPTDDVLVPTSMAEALQKALTRLEREVGDIDTYTMDKLGYASKADLHQAFSALQIDAVAASINNIEKGNGLIIADQTGVGKGRQAAAIIRYAERHGKIPVFVTKGPDLFTDMYRDLTDIDAQHIKPFIMNNDAYVVDGNKKKLFRNNTTKHTKVLAEIKTTGKLPSDRNAMFMSYSQIQHPSSTTKRQVVNALAGNAIFILDESHNAGGMSGTGKFFRDALAQSPNGVVYLSATYAKRPDNMPLYFRTDMSIGVESIDDLISAVDTGGVQLQTVLSSLLAQSGQLFRRERSFKGITIQTTVDTDNTQNHEAISNETTDRLRHIIGADRLFHDSMEEIVDNMEDLLPDGAVLNGSKGGNKAAATVDHHNFSAVVHNFVRQMLLGMKADTAAEKAIEALKAGQRPVIALENTMGSFLSEYAKQNGIKSGEAIPDFDYRTVLTRALHRTRRLSIKDGRGDPLPPVEVPIERLPEHVREQYDLAQSLIDDMAVSLPASPIDRIRHRIEQAGYSVGEITGRNQRIDYSSGTAVFKHMTKEDKDRVAMRDNYNSGKLDVLILNVAGSTGISLHASEKFTDQRQRKMIVAQPMLDINVFVQMLGRINRTGQVTEKGDNTLEGKYGLPQFEILNADLPAEKRPTAVLSLKMKSLNANTTANTESATSVDAVDMLNKYGDEIVARYLEENSELARYLGVDPNDDTDITKKATGRLALMDIGTQRRFYDDVENEYLSHIEYLDRIGMNDLKITTLDLDAKQLNSSILVEGKNQASPFGQDAILGSYDTKMLGKPPLAADVRNEIENTLGTLTPDHYSEKIILNKEEKHKAYMETLLKRLDDATTEQAQAKTDKQKASAMERVQKLQEEVNKSRERASHFANLLRSDIKAGSLLRLEIAGEPYIGAVTHIQDNTKHGIGDPYANSKTLVTFMVNGGIRHVTVPFSKLFGEKGILKGKVPHYDGNNYTVEGTLEKHFDWAAERNIRENRFIVTGNLLAAYAEISQGHIVSFTTDTGHVEQGILLPKKFDASKDVRGELSMRYPEAVIDYLNGTRGTDGARFGVSTRDQSLRVLPKGSGGFTVRTPKAKAKGGKWYLDKKLLEITGDFFASGNLMEVSVTEDQLRRLLPMVMDKMALFVPESQAETAQPYVDKHKPKQTETAGAFSKSRKPATGGLSVDQVEKAIAPAILKWGKGAPAVRVIQNVNELPPSARDQAQAREEETQNQYTASGYFDEDTNTIYIVADGISTTAMARKTLAHEAVGHFAMEEILGDEFDAVVEQVTWLKKNGGKKIQAVAAEVRERFGDIDERTEAREIIAVMAEKGIKNSLMKRVYAAFRRWLRKMGLGLQYTEADLEALIARAGRQLQKGFTGERRSKETSAFSMVRGTDAQESAIEATMGKPTEEITFKDRVNDFLDTFRKIETTEIKQGLLDEFTSIAEYEKQKHGTLLDASESATKAARRTKNLDSVMAAIMLRGPLTYKDGGFQLQEGKTGFVDIFSNLADRGLLRLWEAWAAANRANRLKQEGREHNFTQEQIDELLKLEKKYPEFRKVLDEWSQFNQGILDMAEQAGVINPDERALWEKNDYVPFYRVMEELETGEENIKGPRRRRGLSGQSSGIRKLKGGEERIGSVIENMVMNMAKLVDASFKNIAMQRVVELAEGTALEAVEPGWKPVKLQAAQLSTGLKKLGVDVERMPKHVREQYSTLFQRIAPQGPDIVAVRYEGKMRYYRVNDPLLMRSITSFGPHSTDALLDLMRGSKKLLTHAVTVDPAFMIANFIRDTVSTWVVTDTNIKPVLDSTRGFMKALKEDESLLQIMAGGGGGGGYYQTAPEDVRAHLHDKFRVLNQKNFKDSVLDTPRKLWRFWQKIGAASENANRIAIYEDVLKRGGTVAEAVHQAQDVLNFSMRGDWAAIRFLTETVPFLNARLQGIYRLGRGYLDNPKAFATKGSMIMVASIILWLANKDDERYKELPEWDKDTYWHFFTDDGGHYRLPKPFEVGAIFGTVPERMLGYIQDHDGELLAERVAHMFLDTFAFNPIPQLFRPLTEQYANKVFFTGKPIIGMGMQRLRPEEQYNPWTSETMREIAQGMPDFAPEWMRSPKRLETALRGYVGTMGMYVLGASDMFVRQFGDYPKPAKAGFGETPVIQRFVRDEIPKSTKYSQVFYDMMQDANAVMSSIKKLREEGRLEEAAELQRENRSLLQMRLHLNRVGRQLTKINHRIRNITNNRRLTPERKRDILDQLQVQKNRLTKQAAQLEQRLD